MIKLRNEKNGNIFYYLLVIYMLYITDSMLFGLNSNQNLMYYAKLSIPFVGTLFLIYHLVSISFKIKYDFIVLVFIFGSLLLSSLANSDTSLRLLLKVFTLLLSYIIVKRLDKERFIVCYINLMVIISIISLIGYLFPTIFTSISFIPKLYTHKYNMEFVTLGFTNIPTWSYMQGRNWGPFWEPGAYQAFLNVALFFVLFVSKTRQINKLLLSVLFVVTIITTLSTTGYIALPFFIFAYLLNNRDHSSDKWAVRVMIFLAFVVIVMIVMGGGDLFSRVITIKIIEGGANPSRFISVYAGIKLWLKNPIFGVGPQSIVKELILIAKQDFTFTNTIIAQFAIYGTFVGIYYVFQMKSMVDSLNNGKMSKILLYIGFIILLSGENFNYSPVFTYLMFFRCTSQQTTNIKYEVIDRRIKEDEKWKMRYAFEE